MPKYLNIKQGDKLKSVTCFRENEQGENVIQTELASTITLTDDPGDLALPIGKALKGSFRVINLGNGQFALRTRRFQHDSEAAIRQTPENIASTAHGQCYRTARQTKLVFTFPRDISFDQLLDHLDDELWDLKQTLEKEAPC